MTCRALGSLGRLSFAEYAIEALERGCAQDLSLIGNLGRSLSLTALLQGTDGETIRNNARRRRKAIDSLLRYFPNSSLSHGSRGGAEFALLDAFCLLISPGRCLIAA